MATGPVAQILFRTPICAVNSTDHLRVYTQDVFGNIRESLYESGWANGTIKNVIAQGKLNSPMSATSKELNEIRVYYLSNDNKLREMAYSANRGWYNGDLNDKNFTVAPYSKVAATFLPGSSNVLRVYVQSDDDTIQEYGYDGGSSGWQKMTNLGAALPGTELAATSFKASQLGIRVYLQDTSLQIFEKAYDDNQGWYTGGFSIPNAAPRATLSCCSFNASSSGVSLRIYYSTLANTILERAWDGSWYDGGFQQPCVPGSESAVINWGKGSDLQLRVYFQNGTKVTGVSEWCYSGGWVKGVSAIPPA
jgi:hypothetical protein